MLNRTLGSVLLLIPTLCLFEIAGRLAAEQRPGWGWFLLGGLMLGGMSANFWSTETQVVRPTPGKGRPSPDRWDLE
jgi:hypothetical protein